MMTAINFLNWDELENDPQVKQLLEQRQLEDNHLRFSHYEFMLWSLFGLSPAAFVASYKKDDETNSYQPHFYIIDFQKKGSLYSEEKQMKLSQAPSAALTLKKKISGEIIGIVTFGDTLDSRTVFIAEKFHNDKSNYVEALMQAAAEKINEAKMRAQQSIHPVSELNDPLTAVRELHINSLVAAKNQQVSNNNMMLQNIDDEEISIGSEDHDNNRQKFAKRDALELDNQVMEVNAKLFTDLYFKCYEKGLGKVKKAWNKLTNNTLSALKQNKELLSKKGVSTDGTSISFKLNTNPMLHAGDDKLECNDALTQRVLTGIRVGNDFNAFKEKYHAKFESEFFKNKKSWMKVNLDNGQVNDIDAVTKHAKENPTSRTAELLLWP